MAVEETLYSRLTAHAGTAALVGDRVFPNVKVQDAALPAISYRRISSVRFSAMGVDSGVVKARFQIDVWASTYDDASALRDQVRSALQRWSTNTGTVVQDTFILNETDLYEDETKQHHIAIDVEINYSE